MLVTAIIVWVVLIGIRSTALSIFLSLPSTLVHELSHWIVALVSGCAPGFPSILPRKEGSNWVLGSVTFDVRQGRAAFVALAPVWLLAPLAFEFYVFFSPREFSLEQLIGGVGLAYLVKACAPSPADIRIAFEDPLGLLLTAGLLTAEYAYYLM